MLTPNDFRHRRKQLMRQMKKNSVALVASAPASIRNRDVEYPYRQHSDFHYLTGFHEPEAVAVLAPGCKEGEFILFCRPFDPEKAIWTGRHAGLEGARAEHGADQAFPIEALDEQLPRLLENRERVYFPIGQDAELDHALLSAVNTVRGRARNGVEAPHEFIALEHLLHELRLIKSPEEIRIMRRAAEVSVLGHRRAMRACRPGRHEYEIEAELAHEFALHGMRSLAYPSIVAGGANACVLHYTQNDAVLGDGDLLLIDAGAECANYAADITRTFPVNGRFSKPQRLIYELVLEAQLTGLDAVVAGSECRAVDAAARAVIEAAGHGEHFGHGLGHGVGLEIHEAPRLSKTSGATLAAGQVVTVEPGVYVPGELGVRIEDLVLVTEGGRDVFSTLSKDLLVI